MISRRSLQNTTYKPNRSGQTLIIAVMVMFIVALVAAVFIGLVARNLFRSERYSNIDEVTQIAEAGIRYADRMLTTSEDGADWRPLPDSDGVTDPGNVALRIEPTPDDAPSPIAGEKMWEYKRDKYPDFQWTRAYWPTELPTGVGAGQGYAGPTGGYTTFSTGQGRFLLRVSYNPNMADPNSKYIKIETVGRLGVFDKDDPTTFKPYGDSGLRRELTAYKPIGITDYLRFVTNKDNRSEAFPLGCPGYSTPFGRSAQVNGNSAKSGSQYGARGGPVRINGNVLWYGNGSDGVHFYLRSTTNHEGDLIPVDTVEIAGETSFADSNRGKLSKMDLGGSPLGGPFDVYASSEEQPGSWTQGGFIKDSYPQGDEPTRRIRRLDPPAVDQPDPSNTSTRYRLLTLSSGERVQDANGEWMNLGEYGWGRGIYIGNGRDKQADSESLLGLVSLRSDWVKPTDRSFGYWKGPYYIPPGAVIVLHPGDTDGDKQPDLSITRTDVDFTTWYDAWGNPRPDWGRTITMPYPNPSSDPNLNGRTVTSADGKEKHLDGNGVIYAEGNIRIRGMLPKGMQLTVVSGQNIYIDGNLLKYRPPDWKPDSKDNYRGGDPTCGLALLAKQYVCVNTTQFFAPQNGIGMDDVGSDAEQGEPPYHLIVTNEPDSRPRISFDYGPHESDSGSTPDSWVLYLRHSGQMGTSYINAWLNPGPDFPDNGLLKLNGGWAPVVAGLTPYVWGVGDPAFNASDGMGPGWGIGAAFAGQAFPLVPALNANLYTGVGDSNLLEIALDQTSFTRNNYQLGGVAVQPFDVRIEAVIYAQEGSFYVLPGDWFNPNPTDVPSNPIRPGGVVARFPFFGQPLDIRLIVDGAIAENVPAQIGDVEEWMAKWGRIPDKYGSSDVPTAHPGEGLTMLYDDHAGWPLEDPSNTATDLANASRPIRYDSLGRSLPFAPRLPVCGGLIYVGDVM